MNHSSAGNPFASTHSLDENPFEDPVSNSYTGYNPNIDSRAAELDRRQAELDAREAQIRREQEQLSNARKNGRNNWPPFFPLIYHEIEVEIPNDSRPLIWHIYYLWLILCGTLIINMIACIFILISGSSDGGRDLGSSIGYIPVIGILSFLLWYRPIYNAYMKEQALYYYFYFFFCGWHIIFSIYMIIGIPGTGSAGLIQMIQMYANGHIAAGVLGTVATVGWVVQGLGILFYYRQIWLHHNAQGHTIDNAKTELATHWAKRQFGFGGNNNPGIFSPVLHSTPVISCTYSVFTLFSTTITTSKEKSHFILKKTQKKSKIFSCRLVVSLLQSQKSSKAVTTTAVFLNVF
ncbi:scamp-domain-containing [Pyrrhoderma noxium]|uniref:Scamp-domain-containing n=1 Tax=Pyrrhoderma noxium TaxID=2282107 RepID=A0A286UWE3_9AGAM|nr:scamp-domain-containing [Pyrrhoderma noxium]